MSGTPFSNVNNIHVHSMIPEGENWNNPSLEKPKFMYPRDVALQRLDSIYLFIYNILTFAVPLHTVNTITIQCEQICALGCTNNT